MHSTQWSLSSLLGCHAIRYLTEPLVLGAVHKADDVATGYVALLLKSCFDFSGLPTFGGLKCFAHGADKQIVVHLNMVGSSVQVIVDPCLRFFVPGNQPRVFGRGGVIETYGLCVAAGYEVCPGR